MSALNDEQPAPRTESGVAIWPLVIDDCRRGQWFTVPGMIDLAIADMEARDAKGRVQYGTPLQANNGRDALVDAYQEALDAAVYLRQWNEENPRPKEFRQTARERCYIAALRLALDLRESIFERDGK